MNNSSVLEKDMETFEVNYKKAVTQMLILKMLEEKETFIGDIIDMIQEKSDGVFLHTAPHKTISKLVKEGYIEEGKKFKPDQRRKQQCYKLTEQGQALLKQQESAFTIYSCKVSYILSGNSEQENDHVDHSCLIKT